MTIHAQVQVPWYPELDEHTFPDLDMLISRTKKKKGAYRQPLHTWLTQVHLTVWRVTLDVLAEQLSRVLRFSRWQPGFGELREGRNEGSVSISHSVVGQWLSPDHSLEAQFLHERETVLNSDRLTNARWPHESPSLGDPPLAWQCSP